MNLNKVLPNVYIGSYPANIDDIDCLKRDFGVTGRLERSDGR